MKQGLCIIFGLLFIGCGAMPKMAPMLNEKGIEEKVNSQENGYIAFTTNTDYNDEIRVDAKNKETGERFRFTLNPSTDNTISFGIGPISLAEKKIDKDLNSKTAFVYQLPPGVYTFQYIYPRRNGAGIKIDAKEFEVKKSVITSFGELQIEYQLNPIGAAKSIQVRSLPKAIDEELMKIKAYGISEMAVNGQSIEIGF